MATFSMTLARVCLCPMVRGGSGREGGGSEGRPSSPLLRQLRARILRSDEPGLEFDSPSLSFFICEMGTPPLWSPRVAEGIQ